MVQHFNEKFNYDYRRGLNKIPFYSDEADYNTNAPSYYDYLSKVNRHLGLITDFVNSLAEDIEGLGELEDLSFLKDDIKKINNDLRIIHNPLERIDYQKVIGNVNVRGKDSISFTQGMTIINERNELYVIRKDNDLSSSVITRYKLSNFEEIDYRVVKLNSKAAYNEGLPYYINTNDEICFIIRTSYDQQACIFNYNKSEKSQDFELPGSSKHGMDSNQKYYFSHFGDASELFGLYLYDFNTVINQKPELIKMIRFNHSVISDEKVQSIAIVDNHIVLTQGKTQPKITVCTMNGDVINTIALDKYSIRDMALEKYPNAKLNYTSIRYEAEGSDVYIDEDGKEYLTVMHVFPQSDKVFITKVGTLDGYKLKIKDNTRDTNNINWKLVEDYGDGVQPYSEHDWEKPQYMIDNNGFINIKGFCTYPSRNTEEEWTEMNQVLFTLPYPYSTYSNSYFKTVASGNPNATNRIKVTFNKRTQKTEVRLESTSDNNSAKPFCVLDGIKFYNETRFERWEMEK